MKSKTIILLAALSLMMLSFGFSSIKSKKKETVSIERNQKSSLEHEINIGLLSEDKF